MRSVVLGLITGWLLATGCSAGAAETTGRRCGFELATLSFSGTPAEQARCLLRPIAQYAKLGKEPDPLPHAIDARVGQPVGISPRGLRKVLREAGIEEADLGGDLDEPLSQTNAAPPFRARYLVIHDTSTPNLGTASDFPEVINEPDWRYQQLSMWQKGGDSKAHVFINRIGQSATAIDFSRGWRAVKFELRHAQLYPGASTTGLKGRFLHVELVQPRRSARADGKDDAIAPNPGFTTAQYERLGLVYLAASVRAGEWLIPAFHAVLDTGIAGGHDDPQRFDIEAFASAVDSWVVAAETAQAE